MHKDVLIPKEWPLPYHRCHSVHMILKEIQSFLICERVIININIYRRKTLALSFSIILTKYLWFMGTIFWCTVWSKLLLKVHFEVQIYLCTTNLNKFKHQWWAWKSKTQFFAYLHLNFGCLAILSPELIKAPITSHNSVIIFTLDFCAKYWTGGLELRTKYIYDEMEYKVGWSFLCYFSGK